LRLLAARAGLAPDAYRRIYAALDETAGQARRGLRFAQRNLAHTDGINSVYLALLAAARAAGGSVAWRGEWACARRYPAGQRLRTLRPDAEARYAGLARHVRPPQCATGDARPLRNGYPRPHRSVARTDSGAKADGGDARKVLQRQARGRVPSA